MPYRLVKMIACCAVTCEPPFRVTIAWKVRAPGLFGHPAPPKVTVCCVLILCHPPTCAQRYDATCDGSDACAVRVTVSVCATVVAGETVMLTDT